MIKKGRATLPLSRPPRQEGTRQDDVKAQAFIQGAERQPVRAHTPAYTYPWENPELRADVIKPFNVRLPEPTKVKLQWLAKQGPKSMHQIVLEAVEAAIDQQIREHLT